MNDENVIGEAIVGAFGLPHGREHASIKGDPSLRETVALRPRQDSRIDSHVAEVLAACEWLLNLIGFHLWRQALIPLFASNTRFGLVAPVGTPRAVIDRISADAAAVPIPPEIRDRKPTEHGLESFAFDPEQFASLMKRDKTNLA